MGIFRRRARDRGQPRAEGEAVGEAATGGVAVDELAVDPDGEPLIDPEERSPELGLKYKDLRVLGALMDRGADMTQPRHVQHYLYASDPTAAESAADVARGRGFGVTVDEPIPEHPGAWPIRCERVEVVLSAEVVREDGNFLDELATRFDLEYDGWEASV